MGDGKKPQVAGDVIGVSDGLGCVVESPQKLISRMYLNLKQRSHELDWIIERAILALHNESV